MRFVNLKGKYGVIVSGIGLLIIGAFFNEILNDFLREFQISLSNFLNCILHGNFNYDFGFLTYKNTSWIVILFVSMFLASYFKICIDKNKDNERAGIKPLNDEVKNINNSNAYNSFRENPCSVILILTLLLVTINQAKKYVFLTTQSTSLYQVQQVVEKLWHCQIL